MAKRKEPFINLPGLVVLIIVLVILASVLIPKFRKVRADHNLNNEPNVVQPNEPPLKMSMEAPFYIPKPKAPTTGGYGSNRIIFN